MDKKELAKILEEIGTLLDLKGENPFKTRAYYNGARIIETLTANLEEIVASGEISQLKGIGKALSEKITTLVTTGRLPYYEELKKSVPHGLMDMLAIPGLGAKKVKTIYEKLDISSLGELEYACRENRLRDLDGFGAKSQEKILQNIELQKKYSERFLFPLAEAEAYDLTEYLQKNDLFMRLEVAGSLRRHKETIKDIDIVGSCRSGDRINLMDYFISCPAAVSVVVNGEMKSTIVLESGIQADMRLVDDSEFPFALHHSTGSKEHNTAMRALAKQKNMKMNEYGLFKNDVAIPCGGEEEIFKQLGLEYIAPELREDMGEIEAAASGNLPSLYGGEPFYGILHVHTTYSDGANTLEEIVSACRKMRLLYVGICDHSKAAFYANGLNEERVIEQHREIDTRNKDLQDFRIFKGIEVDILADGALDFDDDVLRTFDFVIASVHSLFSLKKDEMTRRLCRAIEHPLVTMLGHPTGRLLLGREPYEVDMEAVLEAAAGAGKVIEINASPYRLDLDWRLGKKAAALGIKTALNPDAHSIAGLQDYRYGIGIARKGWFQGKDVLNSYPTDKISDLFAAIKNTS